MSAYFSAISSSKRRVLFSGGLHYGGALAAYLKALGVLLHKNWMFGVNCMTLVILPTVP